MKDKDILDYEKPDAKPRAGVSIVFVACSGIIILTGFLFKLMHWPGASIMLLTGSGALCGHLGYQFLLFMKENSQRYFLAFFPLAWTIFLFMQFRYSLFGAGIYVAAGVITILVNSFLRRTYR